MVPHQKVGGANIPRGAPTTPRARRSRPLPPGVAATVAASEFGDGTYGYVVGAAGSSFVRLQVRDGSGAIVCESNPLWILRESPRRAVPAARVVDG